MDNKTAELERRVGELESEKAHLIRCLQDLWEAWQAARIRAGDNVASQGALNG
jgi:hypothetical protein